jgi:glucan biosynthesis protein C
VTPRIGTPERADPLVARSAAAPTLEREAPDTLEAPAGHAPDAAPADGDRRRYHAFDNLRAWMMLLLIPFHAVVPFITVRAPQHFNDPGAHVFYDGLALFLLSFRRPVFFVVGGFFAAMLLERRGLKGMLANRYQRIVLPLLIGWAVLSPTTLAAYDFARAASQTGSLAAGVEAWKDWSWVNWERPFHLWFLVALLIFYAGALGVRWALPRVLGARVAAYEAGTRRFLASPWRPLVLAAIIGVGLVPSEFLPYNRGNPFLALSLGLFFGLGWRMYVHRDLLDVQMRWARTYATLGLLLLPLATWIKGHVLHGSADGVAWALASGVASSVLSGLLVFGVIGIFLRHADEHSKVLRYLSDSSYWVYLAHMPAVVLLGGMLSTTDLPATLKVVLACVGTAAFSLITYQLCVRHTAIGELLNGSRVRVKHSAGSSV